MEEILTELAEALIDEWKDKSIKRIEGLLNTDAIRFHHVMISRHLLPDMLRKCWSEIDCASNVLSYLMTKTVSTEGSGHLANLDEIISLSLPDDHSRRWKSNSCRFTLNDLTFYVYRASSGFGPSIGLGNIYPTLLKPGVSAATYADIIRTIAMVYPHIKATAEDIHQTYGDPETAIRKYEIIRRLEEIAEQNARK